MLGYILEAFQLVNIFWAIVGVSLGSLIGALPGLGPTLGIALLTPLTFGMNPESALILLGGIYVSSVWGGSVSAILVNAPGTGGSAATTLDGYPLTRQGKAKTALGASLSASFIGGILSTIILIFLAPPLASIGLAFGPAEYLLLAIFALVATASVGTESFIKGILGTVIGLLVTTIGLDLIVGYPRFVFGVRSLSDGIQFIPAMIGMFALAEAFRLLAKKDRTTREDEGFRLGGSFLEGLLAPLKHWWCTLRASSIGTFIGALPGAGIGAACFIAYLVQMRSSKNPKEYGTGKIEGIIAPEASNNAVTGGSLIPTMALAIPGNPVTAILLGTLMMHGLIPGPNLISESADVIYTFLGGLFVANILMVVIGLGFMTQFSRIVTLPRGILIPLICTLCFMGAYLMRRDPIDIIIVLIFGLIGWYLRINKIPAVSLVMGMILGELIERNLYRALKVVDNPWMIPFKSSITIILLIVTIVIIFYPQLAYFIGNKFKAKA